MDDSGSFRRSGRVRRPPARLVPGEDGGLKPAESQNLASESVSEDVEDFSGTEEDVEPSQSSDSDLYPSSEEAEAERPIASRPAGRKGDRRAQTTASRKRGRQSKEGAARKPKKRRGSSFSVTSQQGEPAVARQADTSSRCPGFQELPQAAKSAVTAALLPSTFPASNLVLLALFQQEARELTAQLHDEPSPEEEEADIGLADLQLPHHPESAQRRGDAVASGTVHTVNNFQMELEAAGQVLKSLEKRLESRKGRPRLRYRERALPQQPSASSEQSSEQRLSDDEILLTVGILRYGQSHRLQEFIVAGSQRLTDLRDALVCPADVNLQALGMAVPSAYFYIEGTFYNDLRAPDSLDYSEPIIKFCQENSLLPPAPEVAAPEARQRSGLDHEGTGSGDDRQQASYRKADMHETRFVDLGKLRVGSFPGYVFCHQGCCEHGLYIKDIRRIHPDDSHSASDYPIQVYQAQPRRQRCSMCATRFAVKVTYEDGQAPETPAFWCNECYQALHYDSSGKLKYAHKVFPYQIN